MSWVVLCEGCGTQLHVASPRPVKQPLCPACRRRRRKPLGKRACDVCGKPAVRLASRANPRCEQHLNR